jgi:hypothetical protein
VIGEGLGVAEAGVLGCRCQSGGRARRRRPVRAGRAPSAARRGRAWCACVRRTASPRLDASWRPGRMRRTRRLPSSAGRCRGRTGARCRAFTRSVSPARPPNRTCTFPRIRLLTRSRRLGPWRGDVSAPVAVAADRLRSWPEHLGAAVADLPSGEVAAADGAPVSGRCGRSRQSTPRCRPRRHTRSCETPTRGSGSRRSRPEPVASGGSRSCTA